MTTIKIIQLYPKDMNLYGDWGNTLTLKKRLEWRGFGVETDFSTGDIFVGGGGQDAGQLAIQDDLLSRGEELETLANDGVPMLLICGMYQLFGRQFVTNDGSIIRGIGVLPVETTAGEERLIGNITLESEEFGAIVGYENHSGQTFLDDTVQPLGKVVRGAGNNTTDGTEGVQFNNVIATYLHGSLLPKNPKIADFLIAKVLERRGISAEDLKPLDVDTLAQTAQQVAAERPR